MRSEVAKKDVLNKAGDANVKMAESSKKTYHDAVKADIKKSDVKQMKEGGAYRDLQNRPGTEKHHIPSNEASDLPRDVGPCILMEKSDHMKTASWGNSKEAKKYREKQKELIESGKFREAQAMDIRDIRSKCGSKYDDGIAQAQRYTRSIGKR